MTHVVDVPLRFVRLLEAVSLIEAVGLAATQCAKPDWNALRIGIGTDPSKYCGSDSLSLMFGHDVQMVEVPVILPRANQDKTHANTIGFDEAAQRRVKARQKTIPRTLRIKAPDTLQALAHRSDANGHEKISVRLRRRRESKVHELARQVEPATDATRHAGDARQNGPQAFDQAADFFFGFGFVALGTGCGSGLPSIADRRPEVKV